MEQARAEDREGSGGPWWGSRSTLAVCAVIAAPLAFLVFTGSLLAVPVVYAVLFVEGDAVIYLAIWRSQSVDGRKVKRGDAGAPLVKHAFLSAGNVETLASYVKGAEKGSDFSRREMARTLAGILRHSYFLSPGGGEGHLNGGDLSGAYGNVMGPYLDDPVVRSRLGGVEARRFGSLATATGKKPKTADRGRYLASLEEILTKLEMDMDRSGSLAIAEAAGGSTAPYREAPS